MKKIIALLLLTSVAGINHLQACICMDILTTDSLAQLKDYDLIAYIKITDDKDYEPAAGAPSPSHTMGLISLNIIELFQGKAVEQVIDDTRHTSCYIGMTKGEEWILFGKLKDGKMRIHACDRNAQYRNADGQRDWKYGRGLNLLQRLRKLYEHPEKKFANETRLEYYPNGQLEIEETYRNGQLQGARKIWYPNGTLRGRETYIHDSLDGKTEWFYPSGQLEHESYYSKGQHCNVTRYYYDTTTTKNSPSFRLDLFRHPNEDSLRTVYRRIQPQSEIIYDTYGRVILSRQYDRGGNILHETKQK
ncbi:hypothetical protein HB364_14520 [Pseudoflavitalea sp. X16]|uniref:toxin-antitoxin system YwqK family antitoxin n=1 Tax=Paraflavitalea devenefica TaxID=2716334 RepID=UPI001422B47C|nr:hypothetical protein [Paraflavitalea devenefica]NII26302.1 hypothetical protein [Paraflavitalea devenefica]